MTDSKKIQAHDQSLLPEFCRLLLYGISFSIDSVQSFCLDLEAVENLASLDHFYHFCLMDYSWNMVRMGLLPAYGLALGNPTPKRSQRSTEFLHQLLASAHTESWSTSKNCGYLDPILGFGSSNTVNLGKFWQKKQSIRVYMVRFYKIYAKYLPL